MMRVCYTCYKSHLIIKLLNSTVHSIDADLRLLIAKIQLDTPIASNVQTLEQAIHFTSNTLAIEVDEALLKQTALLLPSVYERFCDKLAEITRSRGIIINQDIQRLVSATLCNWLRVSCLLFWTTWHTNALLNVMV